MVRYMSHTTCQAASSTGRLVTVTVTGVYMVPSSSYNMLCLNEEKKEEDEEEEGVLNVF